MKKMEKNELIKTFKKYVPLSVCRECILNRVRPWFLVLVFGPWFLVFSENTASGANGQDCYSGLLK
jgi:hypothetical protein